MNSGEGVRRADNVPELRRLGDEGSKSAEEWKNWRWRLGGEQQGLEAPAVPVTRERSPEWESRTLLGRLADSPFTARLAQLRLRFSSIVH